jgi:PAS domain S-box-containing protein
MKTEKKIIILTVLLAILIGIVETFVHAYEIHFRLAIITCFIIFGFVGLRLIANQKKAEQKLTTALFFQQQLLDKIPVPIFYKNAEYIYIGCNKSFEEFLGMTRQKIIGKSVYEISPPKLAEVYHKKDAELLNNPGIQIYEFEVQSKTSNSNRQVIFHKATFQEPGGQIAGLIGAIIDITERKDAESKKEKVIAELKGAIEKVKLLSGLLPICAHCKKIRDDKGYWNQIEAYLHEHSEAEFSHSICPECMKKLYPEYKKNSHKE